nr:hypothetical protein [Agreia bicolorata]
MMFVIVTLPVFVNTNEYVIVSPTFPACAGSADFTIVKPGAGFAVTTALDGGDVTGVPSGGVPVDVAVFVIEPASTSACVATYDAVHVTDAPGANDAAPAGHVTAGAVPVPENAVSATVTSVIVTLPVFVTTNEYATASPAFAIDDGSADFTTANDGFAWAVTTALDGSDVTGLPVGGLPDAVAVFVIRPASTSACVAV